MTLAALVEKARKSKVAATALEDAALDLLLAGQLEQVFHGTAYTVNTYLKSLPHARCVAQERPAPLPWADLVRAHVSSAPKVDISKFEKFSHRSEFLHFRNSAYGAHEQRDLVELSIIHEIFDLFC